MTEVDPTITIKPILELGSPPCIKIFLIVSNLDLRDFSRSNSSASLRNFGANRDQARGLCPGEGIIRRYGRDPHSAWWTFDRHNDTDELSGGEFADVLENDMADQSSPAD